VITILVASANAPARTEPVERLEELLASGEILWVDFEAPTDDESQLLTSAFHFHPLAVEDTISHLNHPKIDDYESYVYLVVHGIAGSVERGALETAEIDCFLGERYVVTYHDTALTNVQEMRRRCLEVLGFMGRGPDWLLHALLDRLADTFLEIIDQFDEEVDALERTLFATTNPGRRVLARIFALKKDVLHLKRVVHPARDVYGRIARGEFRVVRAEVAPHFRDVYDHILRVSEMLENFRDVITSSLETYLSLLSQRTNDIVKVLTVFSAVLMTTSLFAGIYGMNFKFLPGKDSHYGFWIMTAAMVIASLLLLWIFRRRKWI
jgi:magnesium transporter